MYHHLRGQIIKRSTNQVVVEVGGVGYLLHIPLSTLEKLPQENSVEVFLYTYLHVREEILRLYGFASESEKSFFVLLLSVSGIGPSVALTILSSAPIQEIQQAILTENIDFLKKIKGIGKKTAGKIALELKDKLGKMEIVLATSSTNPHNQDAFLSLVALGYSEEVARRALHKVHAEIGEANNTSEMIQKALKYL